MDVLLPTMYRNYGKYINHFRSFPLDLDGLKPVERRVLLSAYQVARDKFVKSARVDGYTLGNYHPHASAYSTIVQLVKNGFLEGQGNFGSNVGTEPSPPAAFRYTECKLSKISLNLAFKLINYVNFVESELDDEPEYLPTMFPFCLLGNTDTQGIGFGYSCHIPAYKIDDLYKRLLWLLGKSNEKPIIKPVTNCKIISSKSELEKLLTTGKTTIEVEGVVKLKPSRCEAYLRSWPPGKSFQSILKKISKYLENQDVGSDDISTTSTEIYWGVIKQRNRDSIFEKFSKDLIKAVKGNISYECNVVDLDRKVKIMSVDELLLNTYRMYTKVNEKMLNSEIKKIDNTIVEYSKLEKIRPFLSKHLQTKIDNVQQTIKNISNESGVDINTIKGLFSKYTINKLLTLNTDSSILEKKKKNFNSKLNNINKYVLDQYKEII